MNDTYVLGLSGFYHDAAAAILKNGVVIAAAQEERFSRVKHDPRFPVNAINYCLAEAFIEPDQLNAIAFYDNPLLTYDRIIKNCAMAGAESFPLFESATKSILGTKLWVEDHVKNAIGSLGKMGKIIFVGHHMSHAASSYYPSPFKEAAVISIDGVGEWSTTTISKAEGNKIELIKEINYPHSLGLLYSAFTYYCGFKVNSGEYKLMGLAPYGNPIYYKEIISHLIDIKEDGSYRLNMEYFDYMQGGKTTSPKFHELFGGEPREPESRITQKQMDLAASIQLVTEEIMIKIARYTREKTGMKNLCLSGGVALNCVANGKLLKENIFENIWIQPAAGDAGGALGSAYIAHFYLLNGNRPDMNNTMDRQSGSFLGPAYSNQEIEAFLKRNNYPAQFIADQEIKNNLLAKDLDEGKIIGFFAGRMEFGPRSLGARSIIGDARNADMQSKMNLKIKFRESFRPFAPAVIFEDVSKYFEIEEESPYMLFVAPVNTSIRKEKKENDDHEDMITMINEIRSELPAITHVDYSARIQTVHPETNPSFYNLLNAFKKRTGSSVLVNTSFNVRGEPIVCSPQDAYTCFMRTEIDVLVLGDYILYKGDQPVTQKDENWKAQYQLD